MDGIRDRGRRWVLAVATLGVLAGGSWAGRGGAEEPAPPAPAQEVAVEGVVVDEAGKPRPGLRVTCTHVRFRADTAEDVRRPLARALEQPWHASMVAGERSEGRTDDLGRFCFSNLAEGQSYQVAVPSEGGVVGARLVWEATVAGRDPVQLVLREGLPWQGRVVGRGGTGVAARVTVGYSRCTVSAANDLGGSGFLIIEDLPTRPDGRFTVPCPPDALLAVRVVVPGERAWTGSLAPEPAGGETEIRVVPEDGASVAGRVLDGDGRPVPGTLVAVRTAATPGTPWSTRLTVLATADDMGWFRAEGLVPGRLEGVDAWAPGLLAAEGMESAPLGPGETLATDVVLRRGGVAEGRVLDEEGRPVAGALVYAPLRSQDRGPVAVWWAEYPAAATTDAQGRYVVKDLPPGWVEIRASAQGRYSPPPPAGEPARYADGRMPTRGAWVEVAAEGVHPVRDLVLRRGIAVPGAVRTGDGSPVGGARISPVPAEISDGRFLPIPEASSAPDGSFRLEGMEPGFPLALSVGAPGFLSEVVRIPWPASPGPPEIALVLRASASVEGRVVDAQDRPVPHAIVCWSPTSGIGQRQADASGAFVLSEVPAGDVRVRLRCDPEGKAAAALALAPGERRRGVVLKAPGTGTLRGRVVGESGESVVGATVSLEGIPRGSWVVTGPGGRFAFTDLPPPSTSEGYRVRVNYEEPERLVTGGAETVVLRHVPQGWRTLSGRILDPDGRPVPRARVALWRGEERVAEVQARLGSFECLVSPGTGPVRITVHEPHDALGRALDLATGVLEAADPSAGPVEIRLRPGHSLAGRVVDPEGRGLARVGVLAVPVERPWWYGGKGSRASTDAEGRFRVVGLEAGAHDLFVEEPADYVEGPPVGTATGGPETTIRLLRAVPIAGRVTDPEGRPLACVRVSAVPPRRRANAGDLAEGGRRYEASTDAEGRFRIAGYEPGTAADVHVTTAFHLDPPHLGTTRKSVAAGTTDLEIVLPPAVAIEGRIVGPDGGPVAGAQIEAEPWFLEDAGLPRGLAVSDSTSGAFRIRLLLPGRYRLAVTCGEDHVAPEPLFADAPSADLRIVLERALPLRGRIRGGPSRRTAVAFLPDSEEALLQAETLSRALRNPAGRVQDDGTFVIPNREDVPGTILALEGEDRIGILEGVRPSEGPFTIELEDAVALRGVVRDLPEAVPRRRIPVRLRRGPLVFLAYPLADDATFRIPRLPRGTYAIEVPVERLRGHIEHPATIDVQPDSPPLVLHYVPE